MAKHSRVQKYGLDYDSILKEIKEGSGRVATILAGSFVHDLLQLAIRFNMIPLSKNEQEALFEGNGPLSTFSACIKVGYAMGLYKQNLRQDMDRLRSIRNEFAHS